MIRLFVSVVSASIMQARREAVVMAARRVMDACPIKHSGNVVIIYSRRIFVDLNR